ncbi:YfiR family protein [Candidatus Hydrogenedentota bacterium]
MEILDSKETRAIKCRLTGIMLVMVVSCACLLVSADTASADTVYAAEKAYGEYDVKAALILKFAKYVVWPEKVFKNSEEPIVIVILGKDPFKDKIDKIVAKKKVHGRKLEVKRLKKVGDLKNCHVLFVSRSEKTRLTPILDAVASKSVLTIADMDGFAKKGGIVNLKTVKNKIRFQVNVDAAKQAQLKINSQLLKLSDIVESEKKEDKK